MRLTGRRVFVDGAFRPATLLIEHGTIAEMADERGDAERLDGLVVPGYVDVHGHGGGGASYVTADPGDVDRVLALHRRHGTTTSVASLVTGTVAALEAQLALLVPFVERGELAGIHLEGPWLAAEFHGAHPVDRLIDPAPADVAALLTAGRGCIRMVTLAPERAGGLDAVGRLAAADAVAAIGHTAADYDLTLTAIDAGATGATHLFNAMPPLHHRAPGPILALTQRPQVWLELIFDKVHVHPALAAEALLHFPERIVLITDAMAAAGAQDGSYVLGELEVTVTGGVARVSGTDTIAGSTLTLDRAVQNAVAAGVPLESAVTAATANPADYLGLGDVGRLRQGGRADLVVLDDDLSVRRVMRGGRWIK